MQQPQPANGPIGSKLVQDDPSLADLVLQFVGGLEGRIAQMEAALTAADFETLRRSAHQLKGSGGGYGYPILTEKAAELEQFARRQALDGCLDLIDELRDICSRVVVEVKVD
jgi:HPt (histidine-containing phosphotransfer) domain-containing protein